MAASCSEGSGNRSNEGFLGHAYFHFQCRSGNCSPFLNYHVDEYYDSDGSSDPYDEHSTLPDGFSDRDHDFSDAVRLGASFDAHFSLSSRVPSELEAGGLELVDPEGPLGRVDGEFRARALGRAAIVGLTADGEVADFIWVTIREPEPEPPEYEEPESLHLVHACDHGHYRYPYECGEAVSGRWEVGDTIHVEPVPSGQYTWSTPDPEYLRMTETAGGFVTIEMLAEGRTELVVESMEEEPIHRLSKVFIIQDGPKRERPEPSGETEGDTGTTGDETETDSEGSTSTGGMR